MSADRLIPNKITAVVLDPREEFEGKDKIFGLGPVKLIKVGTFFSAAAKDELVEILKGRLTSAGARLLYLKSKKI